MAQAVVIDLLSTGDAAARLQELKRTHYPDLRGGHTYIDTPPATLITLTRIPIKTLLPPSGKILESPSGSHPCPRNIQRSSDSRRELDPGV